MNIKNVFYLIANKHMKRYSMSLIIRGKKFKTIVRYHLPWMVTIKKE